MSALLRHEQPKRKSVRRMATPHAARSATAQRAAPSGPVSGPPIVDPCEYCGGDHSYQDCPRLERNRDIKDLDRQFRIPDLDAENDELETLDMQGTGGGL